MGNITGKVEKVIPANGDGYFIKYRGIAQLDSARGLGPRGRGFESHCFDHIGR